MNIYIIIGIIVFVLISKKFFSVNDRKVNDSTPPIFDEKRKKSVLEELFGEFFKEEGNKNIVKTEANSLEVKKTETHFEKKEKVIHQTQVKTENIEENNFDIRKAVIYSEILNNPFINRNS